MFDGIKEQIADVVQDNALIDKINDILDKAEADYELLQYSHVLAANKQTVSTMVNDCTCKVYVELNEIRYGGLDSVDIDVEFCDDHANISEYRDVLFKLAEDIWLKDKEAKYNPAYQELFKLAGI